MKTHGLGIYSQLFDEGLHHRGAHLISPGPLLLPFLPPGIPSFHLSGPAKSYHIQGRLSEAGLAKQAAESSGFRAEDSQDGCEDLTLTATIRATFLWHQEPAPL